ncbi:MAG: exopolysaccharide biosynthesis polyprenyl glycosylphosphotransferase [Lachnospiraceae bacterium]|nr:exopolysaccharide biosynthesis polyprenyl glycosylphosphotransferase [Lachnospiraceae bacterium]
MLYVWYWHYNTGIPKAFYFWGHVFIAAVYMVILLFASVMYGGLKVGSFRMIELTLSQGFATLVTNVVFYGIICLLSYRFPTVIPLLIGMIIQCFIVGLWIIASTFGYRALFPPIDVLLVYGGNSQDIITERFKTRRHQFTVTKAMNVSDDMQKICDEIPAHDAVMLWDIPNEVRNTVFKWCYESNVEIYVSPKIMDIVLKGSQNLHLFDTPLMYTKSDPIEAEQRMVKRLFDIILAIIMIVITSPVMLITAIAVKACDGGSVFYKQIRCTKGNRQFRIIKFRSMIEHAEEDGKARLASKNDDRITPVGRVIRKLRIDELPQLFNVIRGDMSFVGPRPERPEIIEKYTAMMPEFSYRTKVTAGITGYAQVYGKYNTRPYDKLKLDLFYIENFSVWLDLRLIILTVKTLFLIGSTEGVSEDGALPSQEADDE